MKYFEIDSFIELEKPNIFTTSDNIYSIHFVDFIEPNYGRVLQEFRFYKGKIDITKNFYSKWNYTSLGQNSLFDFATNDNNFCFLPHEAKISIINLTELIALYIDIDENLLGNIFSSNETLLIFTSKSIFIIDLFKNKIEKVSTNIPFNFPIYKDGQLFLVSLKAGLYKYDFEGKTFQLNDKIKKPRELFSSNLYNEYDEIANDNNCGFIFSLGNRLIDKQKRNYYVDSWELLDYNKQDNTMILGTNFPISKEKENDKYSYTIWFSGRRRFIKVQL